MKTVLTADGDRRQHNFAPAVPGFPDYGHWPIMEEIQIFRLCVWGGWCFQGFGEGHDPNAPSSGTDHVVRTCTPYLLEIVRHIYMLFELATIISIIDSHMEYLCMYVHCTYI